MYLVAVGAERARAVGDVGQELLDQREVPEPGCFPKRARARRRWVLQQLHRDGVLSRDELAVALDEPLTALPLSCLPPD